MNGESAEPARIMQDAHPPLLKIHSGLNLRLQQAAFAFSAIKYLRKNRYPFFTISGCIKTYRLGRLLKLHKLVQLNDKYFTVPVFPHYPSPAFDHMVKSGGLNSCIGTQPFQGSNLDTGSAERFSRILLRLFSVQPYMRRGAHSYA
jgi:hypothetical protein